MTTLTLVKAFIEILVAVAICYGFCNEEKLAYAERKAFKFIRCFIKACIITLKQKHNKKKKSNVTVLSVGKKACKLNKEDSTKRIA